ncbi:hypothetical protein GCM10029964_028960 [Kibdelosporangium lantanae]
MRRGLIRAVTAAAVAVAAAFGVAVPASAAAGVVSNGTYRWANTNSGLCLAYDERSRGANRQEGCDGTDYTIFWDVVNVGGDNYRLINEHNGQCLSIWRGDTSDGASVGIYDCVDTTAEIFTLVPATSPVYAGAYQMVNVNSGKCVAVGGARKDKGAWVIQWSCDQSGAFMWRPYS